MPTQYLAVFVAIFFDVINFMVLARVLLSWVPSAMNHPIAYFLRDVTDPILNVAKKITPNLGMIDLSPMVAVIALDIIKRVVLYFLSPM